MYADRHAYQGILPEEFGASRKMIFGKLTTGKVLDMAAERAKKSIDRTCYPHILEMLYDFVDQNKGVVVTEELLWKMIEHMDR